MAEEVVSETALIRQQRAKDDSPQAIGIKYDGILARDLAKSIVENMLEQERGFVKTSPSLKRQPNTTPDKYDRKDLAS